VGKKELGGVPDFFSVLVLFPFSDFLYEIGCIEFSETQFRHYQRFQIKQVALICDLNQTQAICDFFSKH
jgi:hypothetical protein